MKIASSVISSKWFAVSLSIHAASVWILIREERTIKCEHDFELTMHTISHLDLGELKSCKLASVSSLFIVYEINDLNVASSPARCFL